MAARPLFLIVFVMLSGWLPADAQTVTGRYKKGAKRPSANQVVKDGVDLVTMNATLLEKVEELTLYSIQLAKATQRLLQKEQRLASENKQQQQEIDELKKLLNVVLQNK